MDKKDASGEIPSWRWEPWIRRDPRNAKIIDKTINKGYFVRDLENFDAAFFGISPKEAEMMDPHQRLGLEVTWEALENAGLNPQSLSGSDTAVYIGVDSDDYSRLLLEDLPNIEAWMGIGTTAHGIPNRISYHLDLMGPSAAVDAACASSLVAVNSGRQAILAGESNIAIVGGVNVCISPALFYMLTAAGALAPDGRSLSFDDDAHGYARGEGAAILILKRLSHAIADGDHVLAVLKGTAIAQDGKTNGIMAPNAAAQELVARKALKQAGIDPLTVDYIEAHATSTSLGDPTEISAISAVYGTGRPANAPAIVGSIKPNVGHLEAAAGAISLIKTVMAVEKGQIPPQANLTKLNTKVDWVNSGLHIVREKMDWPESHGPRRAAICSYGYGGTVSHAVIEESPVQFPSRLKQESGPTLLVLSAPQEKRLVIQSAVQAEWIGSTGVFENLNSIAATLAQRRAHHDFRAAFVVASHADAAEALDSFTRGTSTGEFDAQGRAFGKDVNKEVVWYLIRELGYSAIEFLKLGIFEASDQVQVLTYIVQIGLAQLLKSKGVKPDAVIGHSVGEIAASVTAGCLTPEEGTLIVTRRARLYSQIKGHGGMCLVNQSFEEVSTDLGGRKDLVAAIDSSPSSCVISGAVAPLLEYVETLQARGIRTFHVKTDIAFHSPMLGELSQLLRDALSNGNKIKPQRPTTKLYSTSQTDPRSESLTDIDYWVNNMVSPVWLKSAINAAVEDGYRVFLEVSTHPIISHSINETLQKKELRAEEFATISTMHKHKSAEKSVLLAIAQLYILGAEVEFSALLGREWCSKVPGFQWSQKRFWKEVSTSSMTMGVETTHDVETHTMLGQKVLIAATDTTLFTTTMNEGNKPFPRSHKLHGTNIVPAAVYVNTFHHATGATVICNMILRVPLAITEDLRNVQVVVQGDTVIVASRLSSADDCSWVTHGSACWSTDAIQKRIGRTVPNTFAIDFLTKVGVSGIGFPWQVTEHFADTTEMLARVDNDPDNEKVTWDARSWGPTIDSASSVGATIFSDDPKLRIVSKIDKLVIYSKQPPPKTYFLHVTEIASDDPLSRCANVTVIGVDGEPLAKLYSIRLTEMEATAATSGNMDSLVHQMAWVPARLSEKPLDVKQAVLLSQDSALLDQFETELQRHIPMILKINTSKGLKHPDIYALLGEEPFAVVYCPEKVQASKDIASFAQKFVWEVATTVKFIVENSLPARFFIVTDRVYAAESATALAQAPLYGLARVIASEHSDIWGGLIDNEGPSFPITPLKYVQGQDIIRFIDGVSRVARLRPFSADQRHQINKTLLPKAQGTYILTGGLGALGIETCDWLIEKGARRIAIISRRALPPRNAWPSAGGHMAVILTRIRAMEKQGASIYVVPLDISAPNAHEQLIVELNNLSLPPVLGVIHGSGVLEDSLLADTTADSFERVLAPKISGAIALHKAFPPGTLDFFVLYSSIGQLVGTSGQSSYASGNAFLDTLATHRRDQGDNAIAFQWTAWRGLGMGASTDFLTLELQSKGITDIKRDEGFRAWEHMSKYDVDHAVVTRILAFDEDDVLPCGLLEDIVVRRPRARDASETAERKGDSDARPTETTELKSWLDVKIRECIAFVLKIGDIDDIDARVAVSDFGLDSVMTIVLRQRLQSVLKVKVPQTLTWNHPTVTAMVEWFLKQF
ncbi:hypothetical protein DL95DRAFT_476538 [Leptodontidium sp. 2 PMI_412]|nr:hypothetical protein DL95DRAFT_476538 [Leptodontidium sp. 2 PMI_412]